MARKTIGWGAALVLLLVVGVILVAAAKQVRGGPDLPATCEPFELWAESDSGDWWCACLVTDTWSCIGGTSGAVSGSLSLLDEQGTGGNDVTFGVASTPEQMFWFDTTDTEGGITARVNDDCTSGSMPHACCTGLGTGTCGDLTLPVGIYDVGLDLAFSGTANAQIECWVYDDSVEVAGLYAPRKLGTGGDMGYTGLHAVSVTVGAGSEMELWCQSDGTDSLNIWRASLRFALIGT